MSSRYFTSLRKVATDIIDLAEKKGAQYWDQDPFAAFKEIAQTMDIPKEGALMTLAAKHWGALSKVSMGKRCENPALTQERIKDMILYMLILYLMVDGFDRKEVRCDPQKSSIG